MDRYSREFVARLDSDLATIRRDILHSGAGSRVAKIEGDLSDPHNGGHSVLIVTLRRRHALVYKPKDLRLDVAWHALIERLNRSGAAGRTAGGARDRARRLRLDRIHRAYRMRRRRKAASDFFRRAGAWLALFHCFAGTDMHQENMIAAGDHPVPIDLEMILQAAAAEHETDEIEAQAFEAAARHHRQFGHVRSACCPPMGGRRTTQSSRWAD